MKKVNKKVICAIFILIMCWLVAPIDLYAAKGSYSVSANSYSLTVGGSTKVNIKVQKAAGKFTISSSNPNVVSVSTSQIFVDGAAGSAVGSVTVKAKAKGTAKIIVTAADVSDTDVKLITGSKSVTIKVQEKASNKEEEKTETKPTKSSDATLKSITTDNGDIDFKKTETKYTVNVDKTVDSLNLKAKPNDSKAKVVIDGDENFKTGENEIKITVTAEDGTVKKYTINVIKSKIGTGVLKSLEVVGYELNKEFDPSVTDYSVETIEEKQVDIKYKLTKDKSVSYVTQNTILNAGKNTVELKIEETNGKVTVYKININNNVSAEKVEQKTNSVWKLIIIVLIILVIIEAFVILIKNIKNRRK